MDKNICETCRFGHGGYGFCKLREDYVDQRAECDDYKVSPVRSVGTIGNYYGGLEIKEEDGKFFWSIENWNGHGWDEIPESLYLALMKYEDERERGNGRPA